MRRRLADTGAVVEIPEPDPAFLELWIDRLERVGKKSPEAAEATARHLWVSQWRWSTGL